MPRYDQKAQKSVKRAMHKRKQGTLHSGSGGEVTSKKQAIAIGLSEARAAGAKAPIKRGRGKPPTATSRRRSSGRAKPGSSD